MTATEYFRTIGEMIDGNAVRWPQRLAIVSEESRITYAELKDKVDRLARGLLALGVKKRDRVALLMDNRPEWIFVDFALAKIGAILVPINIRYRQNELSYLLNHSKPTILIMIDHFQKTDFINIIYEILPELENAKTPILRMKGLPFLKYVFCLSEHNYPGICKYQEILERGGKITVDHVITTQKNVRPHDLVHIVYTSGTTAFPKGVMLTHGNICTNGKNIARRIHLTGKDKVWVPIPLFFSFGCITAVMTVSVSGATLVLQRYFEPAAALKLIASEKCSIMYATPTIYIAMIESPEFKNTDISSLRSGSVMGSSEQIKRVVEDMGVTGINTGYGMTETSALCSMTDSDDPVDVRISTAGRPFPGVEVVIKDYETGERVAQGIEGEICVKGYNVTPGYYNEPGRTSDAFDAEGFLRTGDVGRINHKGYLQFVGRYKDMLKTSGINVSTLEVEDFLRKHPDIEDAYIVGVPDRRKDEVGAAFIKLSPNSNCIEADILNYCKGKIAGYKIPKYIYFVSNFPLTASGKVQKFKLQEQAIKELGV